MPIGWVVRLPEPEPSLIHSHEQVNTKISILRTWAGQVPENVAIAIQNEHPTLYRGLSGFSHK
jgi:hypothetical protein